MADDILQEITVDAKKKDATAYGLLRYPSDVQNRNGFIRFTPMDGETGKKLDGQEMELQLPQGGLKYSDGMNFENADMGIARAAMVSGVDNDLANQMGEKIGDFFSNIGDGETRRKGISAIVGMAGNNVGQANSRIRPNPNTRAMFKSPNIREFSFDFKMIPVNSKEAKTIRDIVKRFRKHMYPERVFTGKTKIAFYYPSMFKIEIFLGADEKFEVEPKIKPCFLKALNTNYNGSTPAIMAEKGKNFSFAETDLSISFTEEVTLDQADIMHEDF